MGIIWALLTKDLRLLVRDRAGFFFTFFFPLIFAVFFGTIFSSGGGPAPKLQVALAVADDSPAARRLAEALASASEFNLTRVSTAEEARALVLSRKAVAAVVIPVGYGSAREAVFAGRPAEVQVGVDPSRAAESGMLQGVLQKYAFMDLATSMRDPAVMRAQTAAARSALAASSAVDPATRLILTGLFTQLDALSGRLGQPAATSAEAGGAVQPAAADNGFTFEPVRFVTSEIRPPRTGPPNAYAVSFPQGIIWAVMGACMGFAVSLVSERTGGTLARLRVAPIARWKVLLGKAAGCFVTTTGVTGLLLGISMLPPFGVRFASPLTLAVAVVCAGVGFTGLMMLIASIGRTERACSGVGWGVMMVFAMIGGATVPLFVMPEWMQRLSDISPMKWTVLAIEGGIWRGHGLAEIALPCIILLAIGLVGFLVGWKLFDREPTT